MVIGKLYDGADSPLKATAPEFAVIKKRLIYEEIYAKEKLPAKLREPVILVVATTNQTLAEVQLSANTAYLYKLQNLFHRIGLSCAGCLNNG